MVRPRKLKQLALIGSQERKTPNTRARGSMHHKRLTMSADCRNRTCERRERGRKGQTNRDRPLGVGTLLGCEDRRSVSEIFEVGGDAEVAITHELNDGLQFVFLFSRDANLAVL